MRTVVCEGLECEQINTPLHFSWTVGFSHVNGPDFLMMLGSMMFCEEIREVGCSWCPFEGELVLSDAIPEPIKSHVYCF